MTTETKPATETKDCAKHGSYERRYLAGVGQFVGRCPKCEAESELESLERQRIESVASLRRQAGIPMRFAGKGFAGYSPKTPKQDAALKACQAYVHDLEENVGRGVCLVLLGPPGVGKSHLLSALIDAAAERLQPGHYFAASDFLSAIRGNWSWHAEEHAGPFVKSQLLAIDEVWVPAHERDREAIVSLVDERYRAYRPTLLASNLSWSEMRTALGERLCDRLLENGGRVLSVDGESHRSQRHD